MTAQPLAPVFDIQRFSLHDGPGIRTLIFLKGCPLHCNWCQNPESQDPHPVIAFYQDRCKHSYCCEPVCPEKAIVREGFRVNYERCTACGDCVDACAFNALKRVGEQLTPIQLMERVITDRAYFDQAGGITLTGGEPTLYPRFVSAFIDLCLEQKIHTNIETSGRFEAVKWLPILQKLNLIYFDLKLFDPDHYKKSIGDGLQQVLDNASLLTKQKLPVEFRLALVPGYTDTRGNLAACIAFLQSLGKETIHLLEYHNMGEVKIDIIQGQQPRLGLQGYPDEKMDEVRDLFSRAGITVIN
ncbi:MAG: glycyl-radical enzyme activating protein [Halieaceae bacterium]|jgi:pyruvate formate lyase activating enzyme|nr:glycyl-radical enzyme activating protein [Halieaceae bacterium]